MPRDTSGAFLGKYRQDPREFDPRRCCRIFIDAHDGTDFASSASGTVRQCNYFRAASGSITHNMQYDERVGNFFRLNSLASTAASRSWLTERVAAIQNALMAGIAEMDVQAMVRVPAGSASTGMNVGFVAAHGTPGPEMYNGIYFECFQSGGKASTWSACTSAWNPATTTPIHTRIDTKVSAFDWHVLRVWVNKDATEAIWSIDDVVVRTERNKSLFPTWENQLARGDTNPNIVAAFNGLQACCRIRADDSGSNEAGSLDVNWFLYRYFREYT